MAVGAGLGTGSLRGLGLSRPVREPWVESRPHLPRQEQEHQAENTEARHDGERVLQGGRRARSQGLVLDEGGIDVLGMGDVVTVAGVVPAHQGVAIGGDDSRRLPDVGVAVPDADPAADGPVGHPDVAAPGGPVVLRIRRLPARAHPAGRDRELAQDEIDARIAPSSVHRHYRTPRRMLEVAVEKQKILSNPCARVEAPRVPKREMAFLSW